MRWRRCRQSRHDKCLRRQDSCANFYGPVSISRSDCSYRWRKSWRCLSLLADAKAWRENLLRKRYGLDLPQTILMPSYSSRDTTRKLLTIRLRLLDREIKVLFHFQVSREAFGTHSSGKEKL